MFLLLARPQSALAATAKEQAQLSTASVVLGKSTLFYVTQRVLSLTPEDRARLISDRLKHIVKDPLIKIESLSVDESEATSDIAVNDLIIMSVTDKDAIGAGKGRHELASEYVHIIQDSIKAYRHEYSVKTTSLGVLFTLLATGALLLFLKLLSWAFPRVYSKIDSLKGTLIPSIRIQKMEIIPAERIADLLAGAAQITRILMTVILFYFYIPLVFSFFPLTRGYTPTFFSYILDPLKTIIHGVLNYLPNIFFIAVIVFATKYFLKLIWLIFREVDKKRIILPGFHSEWAIPTYQIVRFIVIAFAAVVIFPYLPGSSSPAFKGISVFLGVLFSFGSSASIGNIIAGVILTYMRPFKIGERVKIADTIGDVVERTLLVTRVRTIKNEDITIPNSGILGNHIINYSSSAGNQGLILHTSVSIGYDAPWKKVHELLIEAANATKDILKNPSPFVLQASLDDFYVNYEINAYTDQPNKMAVIYSELHQNIQDKFNEGGVEIMSPHYSALRDGNQTTVPEQHLPKSYSAPAFKIQTTNEENQK